MNEPRALVEHFFRHEFGRLCAVLTRSLGVPRLDLVEDVVQAALVQALATWSRRGMPPDRLALPHRPQPGNPRAAAGANPRPGLSPPPLRRTSLSFPGRHPGTPSQR